MKVWQKNLILIVLVVLLAALPLWLLPNAEFGGADGQAEEVILELQPDYEPWFEPILEPASGEVESLLFALQAAIGAGVVGFVLGRITKKAGKRGIRADGNRPLRLSIAAAANLPHAEAASDRLGAGALPALRQRNGRPGHPAGDAGGWLPPWADSAPASSCAFCASRWPSWPSDA